MKKRKTGGNRGASRIHQRICQDGVTRALTLCLLLLTGGHLRGANRTSFEVGIGSMVHTGTATPADPGSSTTVSGFELGLGIAGDRLRPMVGLRTTMPISSRPVGLAQDTAGVRPYELGLVLSLTAFPTSGKKLFVRGDLFPFYVTPSASSRLGSNYRYQASAQSGLGIGIGGSAGLLLRPFVLGLTGQFVSWSSVVTVARYEQVFPFIWVETGEGAAAFATSGIRLGIYLGLRFGG